MRKKYNSETGLFLIELIIVILFFSLASAICIQVFAKSHIITTQSANANQSILLVQNISEVFYSENGCFEAVKKYFSTKDSTGFTTIIPEFITSYDDSFIMQFHADWTLATDDTDNKYTLLALYSDDSDFHTLDICIYETPDCPVNILSYEEFLKDLENYDIWHYNIQILKYKQRGISA